jgi:peptidyl-prolyl cis-trans isomerase C
MAAFCLVVLVALIAASAVLFVDSFSPIISARRIDKQRTTTPLSMGIFDAFQKAFGNEEYGDPPEAIKATARHILVPSVEDANMVLVEIGKGETSFATLAGRYSTCPSKARGGSLGSFKPGTMVKEFDEVVFSPQTRIGEVMGPVQTSFGYHLIVVDKRSGGSDWY